MATPSNLPNGVEAVEDAKRYVVDIDDVKYYVLISPTSISAYYAHENREDNIQTRTVLEKFCAGISKLMRENADVSKAVGNVANA